MHILVVNDDGPPLKISSPYVHPLVHTLQSTGHTVSVILPHQQRSWIGKAHFLGYPVNTSYYRPGTVYQNDGTTHPLPRGSDDADDGDGDEWVLAEATPAGCVQLGLYHYFEDRGPVDLVISGPNFGRNTTVLFGLSSGTIGAALEAALCGRKAIALSYAYSTHAHNQDVIEEALRLSVQLIQHLFDNWHEEADLYAVNVPLEPGMSKRKVQYTSMLNNRWSSGSFYEAIDPEMSSEDRGLQEQKVRQEGERVGISANVAGNDKSKSKIKHKSFICTPNFGDVYRSVDESGPGSDGWTVKAGMTSVTPLKANFMHAPGFEGEIKLLNDFPVLYFLINYEDEYVQPVLEQAFRSCFNRMHCKSITSLSELPDHQAFVLQYCAYEQLDFDHVLSHPSTSLANSYVIRKALIRKHYLANTVANWISKHPDSILRNHVKPAIDFELDYADFLDEALMEAYELRESLDKNSDKPASEKEWWILKPGMSDRGHGIRLFNSETRLQEIFEEWEEVDEPEPDKGDNDCDNGEDGGTLASIPLLNGKNQQGVVTSQLRHFIAQPYIDPPLLLPSSSGKKFHIRTYVLAVGSLKVYVFKEMLALFAAKPYRSPCEEADEVCDLTRHLTNTCLQEGGSSSNSNEESVKRFWELDDDSDSAPAGLGPGWKDKVFDQISTVTGEVFKAAAQGMLIHFQTMPNVFEVFGVDFLVDSAGTAWLLEINAFPDFAQTGEALKQSVIKPLFRAVMEVAVKRFFGMIILSEAEAEGEKNEYLRLVADLDLGRNAN